MTDTDTTLLNHVISQKTDGCQIYLDFVSYDLHEFEFERKCGIVGENVFHREYAIAYTQPLFQDMWRL